MLKVYQGRIEVRGLERADRRQHGRGAGKTRTRRDEEMQDGKSGRGQRSAPDDGRAPDRMGSFGNGAGLSAQIFGGGSGTRRHLHLGRRG